MTEMLRKIWGISFEEIQSDDYRIWKLYIRKPYSEGDVWKIGINEKLLREARREGVDHFIVMIGQQERTMDVPTKKDLKQRVKNGEYEDVPSMFEGSSAMRVFKFSIS